MTTNLFVAEIASLSHTYAKDEIGNREEKLNTLAERSFHVVS
jgi:hypothetical protein